MASHSRTLRPPLTLHTYAAAQNPKGSAHIDSNAFWFCPSHFPPMVSEVRTKTLVSGLSTSCMVMGQLVNSCSRTIPANSLLLGFAIMP